MSTVGDGIEAQAGNWKFSGSALKNFDSHIEKSVPLYDKGHDLICDVSDFFVHDGSTVYEVGCSTGTLTLKLAKHNKLKSDVAYVGVDIEDDMVDIANEKLRSSPGDEAQGVEFVSGDVLQVELQKSDFIVCYYTIQFTRPSVRQEIIDKLYESLNWGGALLLFEKVRGSDARFQDILTSLYTDYKLRMGYSSEDIVSKSRSLKGILEPFSTQGNMDLLQRAGFSDVYTIQKYICFEGFLAIK